MSRKGFLPVVVYLVGAVLGIVILGVVYSYLSPHIAVENAGIKGQQEPSMDASDSPRSLDELVAAYKKAQMTRDFDAMFGLVYAQGIDSDIKRAFITGFTIDFYLQVDSVVIMDPSPSDTYQYVKNGVTYSVNLPVVKKMKVNFAKNASGVTASTYYVGTDNNGTYYIVTATPTTL